MDDHDETFKHNACKKLAQLGKVVFSMSSQAHDRLLALRDLGQQSDVIIDQIIDRHQDSAEQIAKGLIQFRKACVDDSCCEWGNLYQEVKTELITLYNTQATRIYDILKVVENLGDEVAGLSDTTFQAATMTLDSADRFFGDQNARVRSPVSRDRALKKAIHPIVVKTEAFLAAGEARLKHFRTHHARHMAKGERQLSTLLKDEVAKRRSTFTELRSRVAGLKTEMSELRTQAEGVRDAWNASMSRWKQQRSKMLGRCREVGNDLRTRIGKAQDTMMLARARHVNDMNELSRSLSLARIGHQCQIDALRRERKSRRHAYIKYAEAHTREVRRRSAEVAREKEGMTVRFNTELQKRTESHSEIDREIGKCWDDMARLVGIIKEDIKASIERVNARKAILGGKIEQQVKDVQTRLTNHRTNVLTQASERMKTIMGHIEPEISMDRMERKAQKREIRRLKRAYEAVRADTAAQLAARRVKLDAETEELCNRHQELMACHEAGLEACLKAKKAERAMRMEKLNRTFKNDLDQKTDALESDYQARLSVFCADFSSGDAALDAPTEHRIRIGQTKGRLSFAGSQILHLCQQHAKAVDAIAGDAAQLEKAKRLLERRRKTELQTIDEDYETRIQVEQVNAHRKIEALAKLYNAEENQRAREIIEAARKVSDLNNHIDSHVMKKRRDICLVIRQTRAAADEIRGEIHGILAGLRENELREQIAGTEAELVNRLNENTERVQDIRDALDAKIREQLARDDTLVHEVDTEIEEKCVVHSQRIDEIKRDLLKVESECEDTIGKARSEFEKVSMRLVRDHGFAVEALARDIRTASDRRDDLISTMQAEIERHRLLEPPANDGRQRELCSEVRARSNELSDVIADLSARIVEAETRMARPEERLSERKVIKTMEGRLQSMDGLTRTTFNGIFEALRGVSQKAPEPEAQTTVSPPGSRGTTSPSSGNSRRDSSRVITPSGESRVRRKRSDCATHAFC